MEFLCNSKYLVFPVSHTALQKTLRFLSHGQLIYELKIKLDYINPDFEVYVNAERFKGKEIELTCIPDMALTVKEAETRPSGKAVYYDQRRPVFHYTAACGWLNDPNGLVYYNGQYHMFYQHNPVGYEWSNMHWGHAVSTDLVHWRELECALYPDEMGAMFSGSAIVDKYNVTGLKENENDVILLFYTAAGGNSELSKGRSFTQCMAYSTDGGNKFIKYANNPIIPHIIDENRDPKVIRHDQTGKYIMSLFLKDSKYALFSSKNLIDWELLQEIVIDGDGECPDFYPLRVDDGITEKWVFSGASDRYVIGDFDGNHFEPITAVKRLHYGKNSYAAQTWSNVDEADGRRIRLAWSRIDTPFRFFNQSMTFPSEMSLKTFNGEMFLCAYPVKEIEQIQSGTFTENGIPFSGEDSFSKELEGKAHDIELHFTNAQNARFQISLFGLSIRCSVPDHTLQCLESTAPLECFNGRIELRILIDTTGIEIFINSGKCFISNGFNMDYNLNVMEIKSESSFFVLDSIKASKIMP